MKDIPIESIIFLDIETVSLFPNLLLADDATKKEWARKIMKTNPTITPALLDDTYKEQAALHPEFSFITCISVGMVKGGKVYIKNIFGFDHDEERTLEIFCETMQKIIEKMERLQPKLCAHFGKGFDYPFISKRMLVHGMTIPNILDSYGKKPWEITNLDTHEIWKMGGFNSASLSAIAHAFGIPSPKDDIDGSQVGHVYWVDSKIDRIATYCAKDVFALINIFRCMQGSPAFSEFAKI